MKHSPQVLVSNDATVPLAVRPCWARALIIQADNANVAYALIGGVNAAESETVTPTSYGLKIGPGDALPVPFPDDQFIPIHELGFLHPGGSGSCSWFAFGYTEQPPGR